MSKTERNLSAFSSKCCDSFLDMISLLGYFIYSVLTFMIIKLYPLSILYQN